MGVSIIKFVMKQFVLRIEILVFSIMKIINNFIKNIKIKNELNNELKILYTQLDRLNQSSLCEYSYYDKLRMLHYDSTTNSFCNELFPTYILDELKKTKVDMDIELKIASTRAQAIWNKHFAQNKLKNSFYAHYTRGLNDNDDNKEFEFMSEAYSRIQFECAFSIRECVKRRIFAIEKELEKM